LSYVDYRQVEHSRNRIRKQQHEFWEKLPSRWLEPGMKTLRQLSLSSWYPFGFFPKLDLRNVHFPCLENLTLGTYCFAFDWQVQWIVSHGSTLQKLYLNECFILYEACIEATEDKEYYLTEAEGSTYVNKQISWHYSRRWWEIFEAFQNGLPQLRYFQFCNESPNWIKEVPWYHEGRFG
jgi:hypothetical protein